MKQNRKRAPGGGRKPSGPFAQNAAQLTIRMPTEMRGQLEAAAQRRGRSLALRNYCGEYRICSIGSAIKIATRRCVLFVL